MSPELHAILRVIHIVLGSMGFVLGTAAILLPKFSRASYRHRWVGRAYALSMLGMGLTAVPLAIQDGSIFLLVIGLATLGWVAGGWVVIRRAKLELAKQGKGLSTGRLRMHVVFMGSSYIAAWTAFLVNVEPLGQDPGVVLLYWLAPTVLGSILIARTRLMRAGLSRA